MSLVIITCLSRLENWKKINNHDTTYININGGGGGGGPKVV